jgi:RimJ/RimL family protein N-acetyltransferase
MIRTERLVLRPWRDSDLAPFAELNADPQVRAYLPKVLSRTESDAFAARIRAHFAAHAFGLFAVEAPGEAPFVGYVGLSLATFPAPFTPCVEVGWRLAHAFWGRGYATEAARACLAHGFREHGLREILSFTTAANQRSRRVMERLGMRRDEGSDFEHPSLPRAHPLRPHVLYRMERSRWRAPDERSGTSGASRR